MGFLHSLSSVSKLKNKRTAKSKTGHQCNAHALLSPGRRGQARRLWKNHSNFSSELALETRRNFLT